MNFTYEMYNEDKDTYEVTDVTIINYYPAWEGSWYEPPEPEEFEFGVDYSDGRYEVVGINDDLYFDLVKEFKVYQLTYT